MKNAQVVKNVFLVKGCFCLTDMYTRFRLEGLVMGPQGRGPMS